MAKIEKRYLPSFAAGLVFLALILHMVQGCATTSPRTSSLTINQFMEHPEFDDLRKHAPNLGEALFQRINDLEFELQKKSIQGEH